MIVCWNCTLCCFQHSIDSSSPMLTNWFVVIPYLVIPPNVIYKKLIVMYPMYPDCTLSRTSATARTEMKGVILQNGYVMMESDRW